MPMGDEAPRPIGREWGYCSPLVGSTTGECRALPQVVPSSLPEGGIRQANSGLSDLLHELARKWEVRNVH